MARIKFDENIIKYISYVESITGAHVKDCIVNDKLIFIIKETDLGRAIGKKGVNIRKIEHTLKKKVKMVEHSEDISQFIKNYIYPIEIKEIKQEEDIITITGHDIKSKGLLIGRDKANLKLMTDIVKRYFKISEIKIV